MKNTVELIGYYGSDVVVAQSAWTSTSRELSEDKLKRVPALIKMLWENGHETPFEKCNVHFLVTTDIATHIHLLKHRISSINAESARYKELKEDKFYLPEDWKGIKSKNIYACSIDGGNSGGPNIDNWLDILQDYTEQGNYLYHQCLEDLTPVLGRKRAKESARFFKTYNSQITADVQFNLRSFANFLKLRLSPHAQLEVREMAKEMVEQVSNIEGNPFKEVLNVWKEENVW
jgi:thymidylate synthase (FAD)